MEKFILSLDQGTTSSRAIVFDHDGNIRSVAQHEFPQIFPRPGWVEHDPFQIWGSQASVIAEAISRIGINGHNIAAIGITNQRETTIVWDAETGEPVYNAIVWQDRRTSEYCDSLREAGHAEMIKEKTGLIIDAYFSATKIKWILDNVPGARERAEAGRLKFGTVDTWLISCLTRNTVHVTDVTNASRTMLFNIHTLEWDKDLLRLFDIPESMLPEVKPSSCVMGHTTTTIFAHEVPIAGVAGDQQAALFGQMCIKPGAVKNTYGTGCFLLMNSGSKPIVSKNRLLSTIAWKIGDEVTYALEGSVFVGGSVVQWLRDSLRCISSSSEVEALAASVADSGGVYFVPAMTGLGAPYWDLSFPAALKIWVENIYVRNLTFRYTPEGEPVGLAQGKQAVYITTAGSPVGENDWGAGYMRAVLTTLGIPEFRSIRAEGIDIQGWDVQGILRRAEAEVRAAGAALGKALA